VQSQVIYIIIIFSQINIINENRHDRKKDCYHNKKSVVFLILKQSSFRSLILNIDKKEKSRRGKGTTSR
jgi:hypothetical protein